MLNRVSLNTIGLNRIGLNRIGKPSRGSSERPYIDPEVLASLKAVCICYGKSNDDPDRAIVKNLVDPDNPFVISNAAFKLNSGFGKYETELSDTRIWTKSKDVTSSPFSSSYNGLSGWIIFANTKLTNSADIPSFKIEVKGLLEGQELIYRYYDSTGQTNVYSMTKDGEYTLPADVRTAKPLTSNTSGFQIVKNETNTITITQIPSFEGAFVTDGIDDLITSTKTVQEMLGGSNEITVVSMIHQIDLNSTYTIATTNYIENSNSREHVRSDVYNYGKTGIYGYSASLINNTKSDIKNILGDEADYYVKSTNSLQTIFDAKFSVVGRISELTEASQVAWYWTIIANKVLTTDQINQVIAYFNLDRTLNPDILCNTIKQGITNENHAEFGDKLIDYSGNGRDIQLNNIAWKGDSGIGKYSADFESFDWAVNISQKQHNKATISLNGRLCNHTAIEVDEMKVNIIGNITELIYWYIANPDDTTRSEIRLTSGINTLPKSYAKDDGQTYNIGFAYISGDSEITIEQIPSHAGALCLDGVNDFGQFVGDLGLKDYTFIMDREYLSLKADQVPVISSINPLTDTPFIFEHCVYENKVARPFSFGKDTVFEQLASKRLISYQSTYKYNGKDIPKGTSVNTGSGFTIGRYGDDRQYANFAFYFLMLFPYSMSEFLIERQLKKHKLGTLYADMVEFRPIIKQDDRIKNVKYYKLNETADYIDLNIGDYIPVGQRIAIVVDLEEPYKITSITSSSLTDVEIRKAGGQNYAYDILGYVTDKSPQKITMDIQVDSSLVQWNPVVESNAEYQVVDFYIDTYPAVVGNYYLISSKLRVAITTKGAADEVTSLTVNGVSLGTPSINGNRFTFNGTLPDKSPQNINIAIDEYIRFEDIVQPYPGLLRFNDENGNEVSWGGKFRVGSTITRIGNFYENNLLDGLYVVRNPKLNGNNLITPTHVVEKSMVFTCDTEYLLDNNEPKCILSPSRLRIPNSSYKILGYIPDISGHGNHGVIHNSAYAGASGANGYLQNFSGWTKASGVSSTDSVISSSNNLVAANGWIAYVTSGTVIPTFKVEISGIPINGNLRFEGSDQTLVNGVNTIQGLTTTKVSGFYISNGYDNDWSNLRIEQIGEYEGAYCLDGVDDFVTIPTVTGGKQVLMKVNWQSSIAQAMLYDQRGTAFAIWNSDKFNDNEVDTVPAYSARNGGNTYIDGILNKNILASQLRNITHNIVSTNNMVNENSVSPNIGCALSNSYYSQMSLYDFMLFDNISTDDKIKELNEYVGIEAKVELPPYYWDAYGKTNLDEYKATIQQRGVAEGDYDITNYNHAYDKMSGYGGYEFAKFDNVLDWYLTPNNNHIDVVSRNGYEITLKNLSTSVYGWYFQNSRVIGFITRDIPFKVKANKSIRVYWDMHSYKISSGEAFGHVVSITTLNPNEDTSISLRHLTEEELVELDTNKDRMYYLLWFDLSTLAVDEEVTIEMLPLYPNGLVYDGVTDYSENANIPAFTDFTYILKRQILKGIANSAVMYKGNITVNQGGAFICNYCEPSDTNLFTDFSFGGLLRSNDIDKPIIYGTKTSVNGDSITPGENIDTVGINVGKWVNYLPMVFYKLILYPKTIPLLQINFLKNLMERDEIIDLTNPIFIQE